MFRLYAEVVTNDKIKDIALALCGNPPLFDFTEKTQCRECMFSAKSNRGVFPIGLVRCPCFILRTYEYSTRRIGF